MLLRYLQLLLRFSYQTPQKEKNKGFTLIELLTSMILSLIILSSIFLVINNLLKTDQQESTSNETQTEMQMALDYIANDLREATYVYDDASKIKDYIPDFGTDSKPILAFWKTESIDDQAKAQNKTLPNCDVKFASNATKKNICNILMLKRNTYTLVVYSQVAYNKTDSNKWKGQSRITRYQLRQYKNISDLTESTGYIHPLDNRTSFSLWPKDSANISIQASLPDNKLDNDTLVDFVDSSSSGTAAICPDSTDYNCSSASSKSFIAYVRKESSQLGFNQDVFIFLRGNLTGKPGISNAQDVAKLPTLQTQVLVGGVLDKTPVQQ